MDPGGGEQQALPRVCVCVCLQCEWQVDDVHQSGGQQAGFRPAPHSPPASRCNPQSHSHSARDWAPASCETRCMRAPGATAECFKTAVRLLVCLIWGSCQNVGSFRCKTSAGSRAPSQRPRQTGRKRSSSRSSRSKTTAGRMLHTDVCRLRPAHAFTRRTSIPARAVSMCVPGPLGSSHRTQTTLAPARHRNRLLLAAATSQGARTSSRALHPSLLLIDAPPLLLNPPHPRLAGSALENRCMWSRAVSSSQSTSN